MRGDLEQQISCSSLASETIRCVGRGGRCEVWLSVTSSSMRVLETIIIYVHVVRAEGRNHIAMDLVFVRLSVFGKPQAAVRRGINSYP